jgi:hypothetical protein
MSLLRYAVEHGLSAENDLKTEKDPELPSVRKMPGFLDLVAYARQRAAVKERTRIEGRGSPLTALLASFDPAELRERGN